MQVSRDVVFVAGGQPSITYVERESLQIERNLARLIAAPNQIAALAGPTKSGKTVLCRRVLGAKQYVWIEGGQVSDARELWDRVAFELNYPVEITKTSLVETSGTVGGNGFVISGSGSHLRQRTTEKSYHINSMSSSIRHLIEEKIILVLDDFHYLNDEAKKLFLRNIKGAVFNGLSVVLLSVPHRAFDVIRSEPELSGRFSAITVPDWETGDLEAIPTAGFTALNVRCPAAIARSLASEAQRSPFLIQKFCWEICFDLDIDVRPTTAVNIPPAYDLQAMYQRLAKEGGQPVYETLVAGPQSRKLRIKRPLNTGEEGDIYEVILFAIAIADITTSITYDQLRDILGQLLAERVPQKNEVTAALKHLSRISTRADGEKGLDWDEETRTLHITDPYLRFYLKWKVRADPGLEASSEGWL